MSSAFRNSPHPPSWFGDLESFYEYNEHSTYATQLRNYILSLPNTSEKLTWGIPFFKHTKNFVYLSYTHNDPIEKEKKHGLFLGFMKGHMMFDSQGLFEHTNHTMIRYINALAHEFEDVCDYINQAYELAGTK